VRRSHTLGPAGYFRPALKKSSWKVRYREPRRRRTHPREAKLINYTQYVLPQSILMHAHGTHLSLNIELVTFCMKLTGWLCNNSRSHSLMSKCVKPVISGTAKKRDVVYTYLCVSIEISERYLLIFFENITRGVFLWISSERWWETTGTVYGSIMS
jgi:hypothetical protein